jgi:hypothetical protein
MGLIDRKCASRHRGRHHVERNAEDEWQQAEPGSAEGYRRVKGVCDVRIKPKKGFE